MGERQERNRKEKEKEKDEERKAVRREKRERSLKSTTSSEIEREIFEFCDIIRVCIMLVFPAAIYYCSLLLTQTHTFELRNLI
jgi:hypothetical protein